MIIYTATIDHQHGINHYASKTEAGLTRQLANFCREYWKDAFPNEADDPSCQGKDLSDPEIVTAYFGAMDSEFYSLGGAIELGD